MKPFRLAFAVSLGILLTGAGTAIQAQEQVYPEPGTFRIDWQRQVIITNSLGAPNTNLPQPAWRSSALRAARTAAYRDLLEALKGVTVNSTTTVENMMLKSDVIRSKVEGVVRDFIVLDTKYYETMDVGVIVEMPLTGALSEVLLNEEIRSDRPAPGRGQTITGGRVVTGLIVDASGFDVTPAMAPKILDEEGNEVYGTADVSRQFAITQGVVGYHNDLQAAIQNERVKGNPLVVRATGVTGPNKCDVIISTVDANRIREMAGSQPFLAESRVMIILGG